MKRRRDHVDWRFTIDRNFLEVITACAEQPRPGQGGTWITPRMINAYAELHRQGDAHSVEAWNAPGELIGGIYGVDAGGAFSAESMFHHESDASKLALLHLIEHLRSRGLDWMDIQMLTPHLERLGAKEISRDLFLTRLHQTQARGLKLFEPSASGA